MVFTGELPGTNDVYEKEYAVRHPEHFVGPKNLNRLQRHSDSEKQNEGDPLRQGDLSHRRDTDVHLNVFEERKNMLFLFPKMRSKDAAIPDISSDSNGLQQLVGFLNFGDD